MSITGSASYIPTMDEFIAHWAQCNPALSPGSLLVRLLNNTTMSQAQFVTLRNTLLSRQATVQDCLTTQQITRGGINIQKAALLLQFNQFTNLLDGYFRNTDFYAARPYAPSITDGQEEFSRPLGDMLSLWALINAGPAPAGVTLPLVVGEDIVQGGFASSLSALQFGYSEEKRKVQAVTLARARRKRVETQAYMVMKSYREAVPGRLTAFPELIETMPRLTPLPGHTPAAVNASAVFVAPGSSRIVYDASTDAMLQSYQLRGNVGEHYSDEDAVVIATHGPNAAREFVTPFGLNQPGAHVAFKVFVILTTDNEAGSSALLVERPAEMQLAA